jgi:DNA-directed RNA polymerase specialized sigma24 family protein
MMDELRIRSLNGQEVQPGLQPMGFDKLETYLDLGLLKWNELQEKLDALGLPALERQVFYMYYGQEMGTAKISKELQIDIPKVIEHKRNALLALSRAAIWPPLL